MNHKPTFYTGAPASAEDAREVEELRESQRMLASLLQNLPGIAFRMSIDLQWTVRFISAGCFRLTGYTPEDIVDNNRVSYESLTHPDDRLWVREQIMAAMLARRPYDVVYRLITAEGLERRVWERGQGIAGEDGRVRFLEGFLTDVTERHRAEEQVQSQAALLDKARDAVLAMDLTGRVLYANLSAHELFGGESGRYNVVDVSGIFRDEPAGFAQARETVLSKGEWTGELAALGRGGRLLMLESRWTLVRDDRGTPKSILMINTDVTERKKLETQFLRSQRVESIGALAGGIAHDLNNILSPILTSIELIRSRLPAREDQELVDIIETSANRGADMVKQILAFARGAEGSRVPLDLRKVLTDLEKIMRETFPRNLTIYVQAAPALWPVLGDATQLHQLLLNLCVNARDAMPEGGVLTILASNIAAGLEKLPDGSPAPRHVLLEVRDTGCGIPEEIRDRIFDRFFTTKETGKGTGLGLSTVQVIAKNHGGSVRLRTEMGRGTTFSVTLPAAEIKGASTPGHAALSLPKGNGELILVVDDEASVRAVMQRTLEKFGYRVVTATNGGDGLTVFARHQAEIAAVVTDVMMPVVDGPEMIRELRWRVPALPIIAVSGMMSAENQARVNEVGVEAFLAKPYSAEALLNTLARLLKMYP